MTKMKRYLFAFAAMLAVAAVLFLLTDLLKPYLFPVQLFENSSEADAWGRKTLVRLNVLTSLEAFIVFGVGAFVVRRGAMIPALVLWLVLAVISLGILKSIAEPAQPSITYLEILAHNSLGWIAGLFSVIVGVVVGERLAQARLGESHAL